MSKIALTEEGRVDDIVVSVDIDHTYIGDLELDLISPTGANSRLHNHTVLNQHDIKRAYELNSTPELQFMVGEPVKGEWSLRIRDLAPTDTGKVNAWSISVTYQ